MEVGRSEPVQLPQGWMRRVTPWVAGILALTFTLILAAVAVSFLVPLYFQFKDLSQDVKELKKFTGTFTEAHLREVEVEIIYLKILVRKPKTDLKTAREIAETVAVHAQGFRRDPDLILAIIEVESDYLIEEVSQAGAIGLMQVMPQWVEVFGIRCDLKDPDCNVRSGLRLLESYEQLYGDLRVALTVYNRGPSPVDWAFIKGQDPDNGYAGKILKAYEEIQAL